MTDYQVPCLIKSRSWFPLYTTHQMYQCLFWRQSCVILCDLILICLCALMTKYALCKFYFQSYLLPFPFSCNVPISRFFFFCAYLILNLTSAVHSSEQWLHPCLTQKSVMRTVVFVMIVIHFSPSYLTGVVFLPLGKKEQGTFLTWVRPWVQSLATLLLYPQKSSLSLSIF